MTYNSKLSILNTLKAMNIINVKLEDELCNKLNLVRVPAPLLVETNSGLNDDLSGIERPVTFDLKSGVSASVVQSLAKWKRMALKKYGFKVHRGLLTNTIAIRKDEDVDPLHSYYVDQWAYETVIRDEDRNIEYLKSVVEDLYKCLQVTENYIMEKYPVLRRKLAEKIVFISAQQMEDEHPDMTPKERERVYTRKYGSVFVYQVGKALKSGGYHDSRGPDCDDGELNGDILVHNKELDVAIELLSMGIRVNKEVLLKQLEERGMMHKLDFPFHKALVAGEWPMTIGGAIGQSRLLMYLLEKAHIGEVNSSVWEEGTLAHCREKNIQLL